MHSVDWWKEISDSLEWMHNRAWPLGGGAFLLAVLYLYQYIATEQLPLSIASPAMLTALPALLGFVVALVALIIAMILLPTYVLFMPVAKGAPSFVALMHSRAKAQRVKWRRSLSKRWMVLAATTATAWSVWLALAVWANKGSAPGWLATFFSAPWAPALALVIALGPIWYFTLPPRGELAPYGAAEGRWDFRFAIGVSCIFQSLVIWCCFYPALSWARNALSSNASDAAQAANILIPFFLASLFVGAIQFAGVAYIAYARRTPRPLAKAGAVAAALIGLIGLIPPVGGALAGYALQTSASGGRACVVMKWATDMPTVLAVLHNPDAQYFSVPLRILADSDGAYLVRAFDAKKPAPVYFVPHAAVGGIDECLHMNPSNAPRAPSS